MERRLLRSQRETRVFDRAGYCLERLMKMKNQRATMETSAPRALETGGALFTGVGTVVLFALLSSSSASAQLELTADPVHGRHTVGAQLVEVREVAASDEVELARMFRGCTGYVGHDIALTVDVPVAAELSFSPTSGAEGVILVRGPSGGYHCNESSTVNVLAGRFAVWVGTKTRPERATSGVFRARSRELSSAEVNAERAERTLEQEVTALREQDQATRRELRELEQAERAAVRARERAEGAAGERRTERARGASSSSDAEPVRLQMRAEPRHGEHRFDGSAMMEVDGIRAGGEISIGALLDDDSTGFVTAEPTLVLNLERPAVLSFSARDTVLLIGAPRGFKFNGTSTVQLGSGRYLIWVGTKRRRRAGRTQGVLRVDFQRTVSPEERAARAERSLRGERRRYSAQGREHRARRRELERRVQAARRAQSRAERPR